MYVYRRPHPSFLKIKVYCHVLYCTCDDHSQAGGLASGHQCKMQVGPKNCPVETVKFYLTNEWQMIQSVNAIILIKILPSKVQNLVSVFRNWYVWSNDLLLTSSRQYTIQCSSDSAVWLSGLSWYCKSRVVLCITHQTWLKTSSTL